MKFINCNANPKQWKNEGDCVVRALCKATNLSWEEVYQELCDIGLKKCRMPNSKQVYEEFLKEQGFIKCSMPRHCDNTRYTVREFIETFKEELVVISVANHLTYAENDYLYDTWDCSFKSVGNYWIKEK